MSPPATGSGSPRPILPPWCRKSPKIAEVLPFLYLHGLSSGDFVPALEQFLGSSAGLSPATVTRLTAQWQADHTAFQDRDLSAYDYVWADGYRESSEAWADLLRDCARRGMRAPVLAVDDGALGFWNAPNEVFPTTSH